MHITNISKVEKPVMAQDVDGKQVAKALIDASSPPYDGDLPV